MTAWTTAYLRLHYSSRLFNCVDLYRLILREQAGVDLPQYVVTADQLAWARSIERERQSDHWLAINLGDERTFDLVLLRDIAGHGDFARMLALHCGCVTEPGRMIDINMGGVRVSQFRDTLHRKADGRIKHAVLGIYRPVALV